MSGADQNPTHQHHGNSHDRIFGGFAESESASDMSLENGPGPKRPGPGSGRRRRWVRTRTQHLSTLSLESSASSGDVGNLTTNHSGTEDAVYGGEHDVSSSDMEPSPAVVTPPCGRYAYRRPDGNPVTGEGYSRLDSCDLQASARK